MWIILISNHLQQRTTQMDNRMDNRLQHIDPVTGPPPTRSGCPGRCPQPGAVTRGRPHGQPHRKDLPVSLERRQLGTTDLQISTVGFGAWAVGGDWFQGWGPQDDNASIAAIRHAVELGVNWIDTAAIYGLGHSEEVVGRALREIPFKDRPYVF